MVIPAHLADEIANECLGMESFETFVLEEVRSGTPIIGLIPARQKRTSANTNNGLPSSSFGMADRIVLHPSRAMTRELAWTTSRTAAI